MNKSWKLIPKILDGQKTIESRWYQTRRTPWDKITAGDTVFFKNVGEAITAQADVLKVIQFTIHDKTNALTIVEKYGKEICIVNPDPDTWGKLPRHCILIFLKDPRMVIKPFQINKTGFGNAAAWLTVSDIGKIMQ